MSIYTIEPPIRHRAVPRVEKRLKEIRVPVITRMKRTIQKMRKLLNGRFFYNPYQNGQACIHKKFNFNNIGLFFYDYFPYERIFPMKAIYRLLISGCQSGWRGRFLLLSFTYLYRIGCHYSKSTLSFYLFNPFPSLVFRP